MAEINIKAWVENFKAGMYDSPDIQTQIEAGWYDWFCQNGSLATKTKQLASKLIGIMDSPRFDKENCYVWFKNNCPMVGPLYDDFRIADLETGNVLFTVSHLLRGCHGCSEGHWEVWSKDNKFSGPVVEGSWPLVKKFFMDLNWEEKL